MSLTGFAGSTNTAAQWSRGCWSIVSMASNSSWRSSQERRLQTTFSCRPSTRSRVSPSLQQCNLLVESNLEAFKGIITAKFERGERGVYDQYGQSYPRVDVTLDDMQRCGEKLSTFVLTVKEMATAVRPMAIAARQPLRWARRPT